MQHIFNESYLKRRVNWINTRAKRLGTVGQITVDDIKKVIVRSGLTCEYCGEDLLNSDFEVDHIIPISKGGLNTVDNLAICSTKCNKRKSDKHIARWILEVVAEFGHISALSRQVIDDYDLEIRVQLKLNFDNSQKREHIAA